ncbi:unnamed protein product [Trichobilharzia regenti]|nr:unnamed protein product [Trichobilharzia regenti]
MEPDCRAHVIARLPKLTTYNRSVIDSEERESAEREFVRYYGQIDPDQRPNRLVGKLLLFSILRIHSIIVYLFIIPLGFQWYIEGFISTSPFHSVPCIFFSRLYKITHKPTFSPYTISSM